MKKYQLSTVTLILLFVSGCSTALDVNHKKKENIVKTMDSRCDLKPETGRCRASFKKAYYDPKLDSCKEFIWGGCGGIVPFETLTACEEACQH